MQISKSGDLDGWISYFLNAISEQALQNIIPALQVVALYDEMKRTIPHVIRSHNSVDVIDTLFDRPIFSSTDFAAKSAIPPESAKKILQKLRNAGIIEIIGEGKGRMPAIYQFTRLMKIAEYEGD
ncbi:hypothetical protein [Methanospirillum hungatei]|uniref:hypothetical protein n=1 Tax=Methanospirillum hungatei TaxID=2203 RepID=UPI0026EFD4C7|nr:hypothetical protein [Methanospirillum hungatei]MCA1916524.1 hypothetical protein [Methanospirillum hungatei]